MVDLLPNVYQRTSARGPIEDQRYRNWQTDVWRDAFTGDVQRWGEQRQPFYTQLEQEYRNAYNPAAEREGATNRRQQAFRAARAGTTGGSADFESRADIQGALARRLAEIATAGRQVATAQRGRDADAMQAWLTAAHQVGPGELVAQQIDLDASRARAGQQTQLAQLDSQAFQNRQAYEALMSQLIGGQLSQAGQVFRTAGELGVGPTWAQNWGNALTAPRGTP